MADSAKRSKKSDEDSAVDNVIADANKKEPKGLDSLKKMVKNRKSLILIHFVRSSY